MTTDPTSQQVRQRGAALIVLGFLLSGGMAFLLLWMASVMHPEISRTSSSFTGTRSDAAFIFGILGTILVLGITSLITGVWQAATGRTNRVLTIATVTVGLLGMALSAVFYLKS